MNKNNSILISIIFTFLMFSCSNDDSLPIETLPLEFESLSVSKNTSFINEPIRVNINGSNFKSIDFVFANTDMKFNKINDTTYEISSDKISKGSVRIDLINGSDIKSKSINLEFLEHGVFNSNIVDGIKINTDNTERLLEVLGEPDGKINHNSGNTVAWIYTFGVSFVITKETSIISSAGISTYTRNVNTESGDILINPYPYLINNMFDFSDSERNTMDEIVNELGLPAFVYTGTLPNPLSNYKREIRAPTQTPLGLYQYMYFNSNNANHKISVTFFASNIDAYNGENISTFGIN